MVEYKGADDNTFIATFIIHNFGVDDIDPWIMAIRNENKVTYLTSNVRKTNKSDVIFKVQY